MRRDRGICEPRYASPCGRRRHAARAASVRPRANSRKLAEDISIQPAVLKSGMNTGDEILLVRRLRQIAGHAGSQRLWSISVVWEGRHQNSRDDATRLSQNAMQFERGQPWHAHVCNQASRAPEVVRFEKIVGARK